MYQREVCEQVLFLGIDLPRGLKLNVTRGPHETQSGLAGRMEIKIYESCVKNQFIWKNELMFPSKSSFLLCSRPALDLLAGRVFETPDVTKLFSPSEKLLGHNIWRKIRFSI